MKETIKIIWEIIKIGKEIYKNIKREKDVKKRKKYLEKLRNRDDIGDLLFK
jgi:hypothetical protein